MNLFAEIKTVVIEKLEALVVAGTLPEGLSFANVTVEPPRDALHGDLATNAAMVLAKPAKMKPRDIAEALAVLLAEDTRVVSADVAGPGFLNLRIDPAVFQGLVGEILAKGKNFGRSNIGAGRKVNVEFVSTNPTGPLHVGHTRGAVFGDALASLLDFSGFDVTREYVINDGGSQIDALARSIYLRYLEAHGQAVSFPEGVYPGDYLIPIGQALKDKVGDRYVDQPESVWLEDIRNYGTDEMMKIIRADLALIGVKFDKFFSEKSLYGTGKIEACLKALDDKGLIYQGKLDPPKGKLPDDWEAREQTLFKSTEFGDDADRPVRKSDGSWTYFAPDIAYHHDKILRGYDELINVFGADHGGYVKRLKAVVFALSDGKVPLDIKLCQLVRLFKDGEPFKMSKRAGTFVLMRDVVEQVGADVTRFVMLTRKNDAPLDFDFAKALEQSKDNPVFYVQYAYARVYSVLTKGGSPSDSSLQGADFSLLTAPAEMTLLKKLAEWPRLSELAATHHEPHRIAFYLFELASEFHALQHLGKVDGSLRFLLADQPALSQARLAMIRSVAVVISAGLGILGVTPKNEMR
ncbi:MAG: arginine--tRNA ligase [Rhodobacteraceae bacterium]|nr:arginine--tRNA ligase [Paracoccaceae bacterium]